MFTTKPTRDYTNYTQHYFILANQEQTASPNNIESSPNKLIITLHIKAEHQQKK